MSTERREIRGTVLLREGDEGLTDDQLTKLIQEIVYSEAELVIEDLRVIR